MELPHLEKADKHLPPCPFYGGREGYRLRVITVGKGRLIDGADEALFNLGDVGRGEQRLLPLDQPVVHSLGAGTLFKI